MTYKYDVLTKSLPSLVLILCLLPYPSSTQDLVFRSSNRADEILRVTFGQPSSGLSTRISSFGSSSSSSDAGCLTPNQQPGLCVRVSQCPAYIPFVQDIHKPEIFNFFKTHICRLEVTNVRICCARNPETANLPTSGQVFQPENHRPGSEGFVQNQPPIQGSQPSPISFGGSSSSNPSQNLPIVPSNMQPSQSPFQNRPSQATTSVPSRIPSQNAPGVFIQGSQNAQNGGSSTADPFGFGSQGIPGQRPTSLPIVPPAARPVQPSQNLPVGSSQAVPPPQPQNGVSFAPDRQSDQESQDVSSDTPQPSNDLIPSESQCGLASFVARNNESPTWPWLAAVGNKPEGDAFKVVCGGALITSRHIITSAHCITQGKFGRPTHVRLGDYDLARSNDLASPRDVIIKDMETPGFDNNSFEKDIAILTLSQDVEFSEFIQPVCLPYRFLYDGFRYQSLSITGWSRTLSSKGRDNIPQTHQGFEAAVVGLGDCQGTYRKTSNSLIVDRRNLCASGGTQQTCLSDHSAPAVYLDEDTTGRYYLIGMASFGFGCDRPELPVVYTRIGAFLSWVEQTVK